VTRTLLRIGTRGSALALAQTGIVTARLEHEHPELGIEVRTIRTAGDRDRKSSLEEIGGRGVFVSALEDALLADEIDVAIHSLKDVPTELPDGLTLAAYPERADPHDCLLSREGWRVEELPEGARVGTGSARRRGQLLHARPDLRVLPVRGNLGTRIRKMLEGRYEAVVLARAGLSRIRTPVQAAAVDIPFELMLPAPGQGTLVIEAREEDAGTLGLLRPVHDSIVQLQAELERLILKELGAGCHGAVGALAEVDAEEIRLRGAVAAGDGSVLIRAEAHDPKGNAEEVTRKVLARLEEQGARVLVARSRSS